LVIHQLKIEFSLSVYVILTVIGIFTFYLFVKLFKIVMCLMLWRGTTNVYLYSTNCIM